MEDKNMAGKEKKEAGKPGCLRKLIFRIGIPVLILILILGLAGRWWLVGKIRDSLPILSGEISLSGLENSVSVKRDALGVPTIEAQGRLDIFRTLGFLHAQERYFQMDLLRRRSAGELSELFGAVALSTDQDVRRHRLRAVAEKVFSELPENERKTLETYTEGVNAGLNSLGAAPFEYIYLGTPREWAPVDSILVILSMALDLQYENGTMESTRMVIKDTLAEPLFQFLTPVGTRWDAPILGEPMNENVIPGPEVVNLRNPQGSTFAPEIQWANFPQMDRPPNGSNNWAVSGALSDHGGAILANDMHLGLNMPHLWYRADFIWREANGDTAPQRATGVTLPGLPGLVVGSNGHIAWGFTNAFVDTGDLIVVEVDPQDPNQYMTQDGPVPFEVFTDEIPVKGGTESYSYKWTKWGPIIKEYSNGKQVVMRWVSHQSEAFNFQHLDLMATKDLESAMALATRSGIPAQNFIAADNQGNIGWTLTGKVPVRSGYSGRMATSWADGTNKWEGMLAPEDYPKLVNPENGRLWTANNRVVDGAALDVLGDDGYVVGARAHQIKRRLFEKDQFNEKDLLEIQLDDGAFFHEHWQALMLQLLTPEAVADHPLRAQAVPFIRDWGGKASIDSVGFTLVREFRFAVTRAIVDSLTGPCREMDPDFDAELLRQRENPVWRLVEERPKHFLPLPHETWDQWLLAIIDSELEEMTKDGKKLEENNWGSRNTMMMQHPFSWSIPGVGKYLDVPFEPLPGDWYMPRVQTRFFGASQRMVVSPGREDEAIFHMPGGQSGHPMSPYYRSGHEAWAKGEATPFLPGDTVYELTLKP